MEGTPMLSLSRPRTLLLGITGALAVLVALVPLITMRAAGGSVATGATGISTRSAHPNLAGSSSKTSARTRGPARTVSIVTGRTSASVGTLETIIETLNNCGPASVASVLAYWHIFRTQAQVQAVVRADNSSWGMSPVDLPAYAQSLGMRALVGYGGTGKLVKLLIANGFPVITSQYVASTDPIRHYRPIEAYNDRTQTFVAADPYLGAGHSISYAEFNAIWAESDYRFQVIYPPSLQSRLNAVLKAAGWNKTQTFLGAIRWEQAQMATSEFTVPGSWIWFNGYADVAFDNAQIGRYARANAALAAASRQGVSPVLINWVRNNIRLVRQT